MKCPHCKTNLQIDEWFDSSFDDDEGVYYVAGQCPTCFRDFTWERYYLFREEKNLVETKASW